MAAVVNTDHALHLPSPVDPIPTVIDSACDATVSSVHQVFRTCELAEMIFEHVDNRTLLTSVMRVHSRFRDVIVGSLRLERKLFLQAHNPEHDWKTEPLKANPLLWRFLPGHHFHPDLDSNLRETSEFVKVGTPLGDILTRVGSISESYWGTTLILGAKDKGLLEKFTRRGASWRRMQVCQPAVTRVARRRKGNRKRKYRFFKVPSGLTMGDLFDAVYTIIYKADTTGRQNCLARQHLWISTPHSRPETAEADLVIATMPIEELGSQRFREHGTYPRGFNHSVVAERNKQKNEDRESYRCEDFDADAVALAFDHERVPS